MGLTVTRVTLLMNKKKEVAYFHKQPHRLTNNLKKTIIQLK